MSNKRMIHFFKKHYAKRLKKALSVRQYSEVEKICREYQIRFQSYMDNADFGKDNERFSSYLNIYSGLAAYELLRENGFGTEESIAVYDEMCLLLRKVAALSYRIVDLLPGGFKIAVNSLRKDMLGEKSVCWNTSVIEDSDQKFEYKITWCLYYDTCKAHGYPEFTEVFCYHDRYAYEVLQRHTKFIRYEAIGEGGTCCHDAFIKI